MDKNRRLTNLSVAALLFAELWLGATVIGPPTCHAEYLFVDSLDSEVKRYDASTGTPLPATGQAVGTANFISSPSNGLAVGTDNNLYVSSDNAILRFAGNTGTFLGSFASIPQPGRLAFGPDGSLYAISKSNSVLKFARTGVLEHSFTAPELTFARSVDIGPDGMLYVTNGVVGGGAPGVLRFDVATGKFLGNFTSSSPPLNPYGLAFGPENNLYVSDSDPSNGQYRGILRFDGRTGAFLGTFVPPMPNRFAADFVFGPDRNLYAADNYANSVARYDGMTGAFIDDFVLPTSGGLDAPNNLVFGVPESASVGLLLSGLLFIAWRRDLLRHTYLMFTQTSRWRFRSGPPV